MKSRWIVLCRALVLSLLLAVGFISWMNSQSREIWVGMDAPSARQAVKAWYGVDLTMAVLYNSDTSTVLEGTSAGESRGMPMDDPEHPGCWYEMPDGTCLHLEMTPNGKTLKSIEVGSPRQGYRSARFWAAQTRRRVERVSLREFAANVEEGGRTVAVGMPLSEARYRLRYAADISAVIDFRLAWKGGERYPAMPQAFHYEVAGSKGIILIGQSPTRDDVGFRVSSITTGSHDDLWDKFKANPNVEQVEMIQAPPCWGWNNLLAPPMVLATCGAAWGLLECAWLLQRRRARQPAGATSPATQ